MSGISRNTQFAGFAKLLSDELTAIAQWEQSTEEYADAEELRIAQRAYDLIQHVLCHVPKINMRATKDERLDMLVYIPDMTAWPDD